MNKTGYYKVGTYDHKNLKNLCERKLEAGDVPFASSVEKNVPIYDMRDALANAWEFDKLKSELEALKIRQKV